MSGHYEWRKRDCVVCGKTFKSQRALTCSDPCRKTYSIANQLATKSAKRAKVEAGESLYFHSLWDATGIAQ